MYRHLYQETKESSVPLSLDNLFEKVDKMPSASTSQHYLPLVQLMHECTIIAGAAVLFVMNKEGFYVVLSNGKRNPIKKYKSIARLTYTFAGTQQVEKSGIACTPHRYTQCLSIPTVAKSCISRLQT